MELKKLSLKKEIISSLDKNEQLVLKGGRMEMEVADAREDTSQFSDGCSDGCSPLHSFWNCSKTGCSDDCR